MTRVGLAVVDALTTAVLATLEAVERRVQFHAVVRGVRLFDRLRM